MSVYIIKYYDKVTQQTITRRFMDSHFPYGVNVEDVISVIKYPVRGE